MLKIGSFNISGGFYSGDESIEYLDRIASSTIDNKLLKDIINYINSEKLDIICFQEIITTERIKYIETIKQQTDLKYVEYFELSPCNLVEDTECGLAIFSKYPITASIKRIFTNPKLSKTTSSGNTYYTYDKGYLIAKINIEGKEIKVLTHHGFPFRRFNSTPELNSSVFREFDQIILNEKPDVITGDFNAEYFMEMMPSTTENYIRTFNTITTVDNMKFDDILLLKNNTYTTKIIKSASDHFLIIAEFEVK